MPQLTWVKQQDQHLSIGSYRFTNRIALWKWVILLLLCTVFSYALILLDFSGVPARPINTEEIISLCFLTPFVLILWGLVSWYMASTVELRIESDKITVYQGLFIFKHKKTLRLAAIQSVEMTVLFSREGAPLFQMTLTSKLETLAVGQGLPEERLAFLVATLQQILVNPQSGAPPTGTDVSSHLIE